MTPGEKPAKYNDTVSLANQCTVTEQLSMGKDIFDTIKLRKTEKVVIPTRPLKTQYTLHDRSSFPTCVFLILRLYVRCGIAFFHQIGD